MSFKDISKTAATCCKFLEVTLDAKPAAINLAFLRKATEIKNSQNVADPSSNELAEIQLMKLREARDTLLRRARGVNKIFGSSIKNEQRTQSKPASRMAKPVPPPPKFAEEGTSLRDWLSPEPREMRAAAKRAQERYLIGPEAHGPASLDTTKRIQLDMVADDGRRTVRSEDARRRAEGLRCTPPQLMKDAQAAEAKSVAGKGGIAPLMLTEGWTRQRDEARGFSQAEDEARKSRSVLLGDCDDGEALREQKIRVRRRREAEEAEKAKQAKSPARPARGSWNRTPQHSSLWAAGAKKRKWSASYW